jgi:hypothetical protein
MIWKIQINNQKLTISQNKEPSQYLFLLENLFDQRSYKGLITIQTEEELQIIALQLSTSTSRHFKIIYDSPTEITLKYIKKDLLLEVELHEVV